ncbi:NAD-dependent epimerase/dehydratase family protein [Paraburkholderia terrae]|uniref:NAD-dependent dehydratase n=1 Tax=Paraburkholderia terrae TaxID=311230 RepID=A0A2I8EKX7_9BURK|nr:NAD-dependent epimerase/dehydratase family protein [Paraburkholderia terrae]AUT60256.1 NAD-dependent dehydratase [Paraburkholderia terrae]
MQIAVSGANGFVGRALCRVLLDAGHGVTALVRRPSSVAKGVSELVIPDDHFASIARGNPAIGPIDAFVHLAARVHVMQDGAADPLAEYRAVNVKGTLDAASAAFQAGARRFVFVSSVKALGEGEPGRPWREDDEPAPTDPYGISKFEAEQALLAFGQKHGMEVAVVRPPLVYGPGVRANFLGLMRAIARGVPLPIGSVDARRSMVYVDNLADALRALATASRPVHGVYHATDDDDLTVAGMARAIGVALGRPARLIPVPVGLLRGLGSVTGKVAQVDRLTSPLRMSAVRLHEELGWTPPWTVAQGLAATAHAFYAEQTQ